MKTAFIFRVILAGLLLGLMAVACQKDDFTVVPETTQEEVQAFEVPDVPEEVAQHFTEEELAAFRAGPSEALPEGVEFRKGHWHAMILYYEMEIYHRPILNSCEEPEICTNLSECSDPSLWMGIAEPYITEAYWFGLGPVTTGSDGKIYCNDGWEYTSPGWFRYRNSYLYNTDTRISTEFLEDGSIIIIDRFEFTGGTGRFKDAYGYCYARTIGHQDDLPDLYTGQPGHTVGYALGWVNF